MLLLPLTRCTPCPAHAVSTLPASRELPTRALRCAVPPLALRLDRMAGLVEAIGRAFVACRPLVAVRVGGAGGELVLGFVDAVRGIKMEVGLALDGLLEPRLNAGEAAFPCPFLG